ncbi:ParA family protein [Undibacterium luofuense]|jgi:chromosome partitioning protein|uniref:ParA family protein n=1 Tax=Undibacterium luofuense TaxID=2828733 RepID=A0A941DPQ0_9BURK|nr:ParA family protein [Undibacterium luofuense]MBR7783665.1 ParA family protein [Undibacterium luofuense]
MIIVVGAEKGGVGKTLISTNIAALAASEGVEVCLMDTDPQGSATAWARIRRSQEGLTQFPVVTIPPDPLYELQTIAPKFDLIVVDIGAQNYRTMEKAAILADMIIVPTGADQLEAEATLRVCSILQTMDARHKDGKVPVNILLNQMPTNAKSKEAAALREFFADETYPVFQSELKGRASWRNSRRAGAAMHEMTGRDADPKATAEIRAVYEEIKALAGA